ncbi:alpha/beta hydrolase family esterase [Microbacterium luticocti]|uniref:alpha/beta hydrolase family esterase n=1 Tax=Microbacterium luticocti TaxID=451764 RepID=UPI000685831E|nr:PHB depolymerase family esterase [Microbacterium luticocti]
MRRGMIVGLGVAAVIVVALGVVWALRPVPAPSGAAPGGSATSPNPTPSASAPGGAAASLAVGSHAYTIDSGGRERTYRVYVPRALHGPAPLVVMLHGGGGSGANAEKFYGWDAAAAAGGFVVAYPDGLGPQVSAWNVDGGGCCGYPAREGVDDVGFVTDMVAAIERAEPIDTARVYAAGISNGGILAYTLACETDLFAAIGADSATMLDGCAHPQPTSVLHVHGLEDTTIPFDGSPGTGPGRIDGPPVDQVMARWRTVDGCGAETTTVAGVVSTSLSVCPEGRAVELITIADAGHGWPGAPLKSGAGADRKQPSQAVDTTAVMWDFFAAHPRTGS